MVCNFNGSKLKVATTREGVREPKGQKKKRQKARTMRYMKKMKKKCLQNRTKTVHDDRNPAVKVSI